MAGESKKTTDHEVIQHWAEDRGGVPTTVRQTEGEGGEPGVLRFRFPDGDDQDEADLEDISWDEFFNKFDEKNLAFLYQDETRGGRQSRFFKFVNR